MDNFQRPILITGLPRSGTSMIAGILANAGAWTGSTVPGNENNPKGYFEHIVIREHVTKKILAHLKCDPLGVARIPPRHAKIELPNLGSNLKAIVEKDGYTNDRPWLYKDAKMTLLWDMYNSAFKDPTWVVVTRNKDSFIDSCLRTRFMYQHSTDRAFWERFHQGYIDRLDDLEKSGARLFKVSSEETIAGNYEQVKTVIDFLGLEYDEASINEFVNPGFWDKKK